MIGGVGNVPGAIVGSLLLGLVESYGIAWFGTSYRNLFAFVVLIVVLVLRPNGLFSSAPAAAARAADRHLHRAEPRRCACRAGLSLALGVGGAAAAAGGPQAYRAADARQSPGSSRMLALSLTLVAGTVGQISLGHAGLLAIGAYASALLALDCGLAGRHWRSWRPG